MKLYKSPQHRKTIWIEQGDGSLAPVKVGRENEGPDFWARAASLAADSLLFSDTGKGVAIEPFGYLTKTGRIVRVIDGGSPAGVLT
jgi:hypothetical protein